MQFKRRFWEQDEQIYGGITYTDLPIGQISYPSSGFFGGGKGVLLGAYIWDVLNAMQFTSMTPAERVAKAVEYGSQIHPQYQQEFDNGVAVAWHRAPFTMGCFGLWTEATRAEHYDNLCRVRRPHRARRRACLVPAGLAGRRRHLRARCNRPAAPARARRGRRGMNAIARRTPRIGCRRAGLAVVIAVLARSRRHLPARADVAGIFDAATVTTTDGKQIYEQICQGCHMPDAQGAVGAGRYPALAKDPTLVIAAIHGADRTRGTAQHAGVRRQARDRFLGPPLTLTDEQIAAVINYVRTHFGNHHTDSLSAAEVAALDR